jgi:hypothetical protein
MINEVVITAKFVTGTTEQDFDQAKKSIERMFLKILETALILPQEKGTGLFSVEILKVEAEKI